MPAGGRAPRMMLIDRRVRKNKRAMRKIFCAAVDVATEAGLQATAGPKGKTIVRDVKWHSLARSRLPALRSSLLY